MGRKMGGSSPPFVSIARIRSSGHGIHTQEFIAFHFSYGRDSSFSGWRVIITIITPLVRAPSFFYFLPFLHFLTIRHKDARAGQRGREEAQKNSKVSSPLFCRPYYHYYTSTKSILLVAQFPQRGLGNIDMETKQERDTFTDLRRGIQYF